MKVRESKTMFDEDQRREIIAAKKSKQGKRA
jgi:hypothetical protein